MAVTTPEQPTLPLLDLSLFLQGNAAEQKQFADDFCNCLKAHGFAKLINHGLDDESVKQLYHWVSLTPSPLYTQHCGILVNVYHHLPLYFHHMLFTSCLS